MLTERKKKRLAWNPDAIAKIKELWFRSPRPSLAEMGREVGYPKSTVDLAIKRLKKKGEIS